MVFASHVFLFYFLPVFLLFYFLSPTVRAKNYAVIFFSYFFYAWGAPHVAAVLFVSATINYILSLYLVPDRVPETTRKMVLSVGIIFNLTLLGYYKYFNFFVTEANSFLQFLGYPELSFAIVALPAGISFFTFQKISYLVDVYRGTAAIAQSFGQFQLFVVLFPQLIAGPIVRYHDIADQIGKRNSSLDTVFYGAYRFATGLGKKVLIADQMGMVADNIFGLSTASLSTGYAWLGVVCYSMQIYFDFSGYSDMAIGLGRMMGFTFLENFDSPYISQSITEFWRRWHISLSNFMREYLYIPLGGNRGSNLRTYVNLWIVFLISGLWHGASWTFVFWGAYHGLWLTLDRVFMMKLTAEWPKIIRMIVTFLLVNIGWVFFRAHSIEGAFEFLGVMFNPSAMWNPDFPLSRMEVIHNRGIFILLVAMIIAFGPGFKIWPNFARQYAELRVGLTTLWGRFAIAIGCYVFALMAMSAAKFSPFLYFNF